MGECVCNSCKNLKRILDEDKEEAQYKCDFGFPSDECEDCIEEECSLTCVNYQEDGDDDTFIVTNCKGCGREIKQVYKDNFEGDVFCVDCYLKKG